MKKLVLCVILLSIISELSYGQMQTKGKAEPFENFQAIKIFLKSQEKKGFFSGTVLVNQKGKVLINDAFGMADIEKRIPNKTNTKINLGSINKAFTAVCVMQLVDSGKIKLEDKVVDYIPELNAKMANEITILNLLEMKSGLSSYWDSKLFLSSYKGMRDIEDYLSIIVEYELNSKPGTERQYSNSSYELLGILVQRVSGKNYYEYVRENVYAKANMVNTDAYERDVVVANLAQGYSKYKEGEEMGMPLSANRENTFIYNVNDRSPIKGTAAGGGYSTLEDLKRFVEALTSDKLLSKESTNRVINHFRPREGRNPIYSVRGGSYGINASIFYNKTNELLIVVLANYDPPTASEVSRRLIATFN